MSQANLTNANFAGYVSCGEGSCGESPGANLTNANLSGADARGANFYLATLDGTDTSNLIQRNGHIAVLDLTAGASLVVRDYDGDPAAALGPLPIVVEQHLAMDATGTLRLVFDADPWDSTISFALGIPVARGGTLELTFAPEVNLVSQLGRTIDLFNWTGVNPTGAFTISSPYTWNLSNLYTTGEITLTALAAIPGDFNNNGVVDAADYIVWRKDRRHAGRVQRVANPLRPTIRQRSRLGCHCWLVQQCGSRTSIKFVAPTRGRGSVHASSVPFNNVTRPSSPPPLPPLPQGGRKSLLKSLYECATRIMLQTAARSLKTE